MPRPKPPTALLKLTGAYRKDRHGQYNEPQPKGVPVMPANMPYEAQAFWERVVPGLVATGVATDLDQSALEHLALWWAIWAENISLLHLPPESRPLKWLQDLSIAEKNWISLAGRFGMTPSDRTKVNAMLREEVNPAKEYVI